MSTSTTTTAIVKPDRQAVNLGLDRLASSFLKNFWAETYPDAVAEFWKDETGQPIDHPDFDQFSELVNGKV